ncbi:MAG: FAD-binding protein [Candidatus Eisenbacteria bacterium]|nr:FAD-binding protein [Candidatus Eisenbacteria bacterium]
MVSHDVLVVGGGLAGLRAAVECAFLGVDVAVVSKVHPVRSHSGAAQGGVNAPLGNHPDGKNDSPELHAYDTIKGSDFLADQDAAEIMTGEAAQRIYEMEHWGCPFSRTEEGKIAQRPFGGGGFPRTCYGADRTGHYLLQTLFEQATRLRIKVYCELMVSRLVQRGDVVSGIIATDLKTGEIAALGAKAVIFATGGSGRIYSNSTNALISTGLGVAIPYWAGVPVKDMEFVQFHPTSLYGTNILVTEGARGEGGFLLNNKGERFMKNYVSERVMELAPRDIVSRSIQTEVNEGRGFENAYVHLDLRHLGRQKIEEKLPGIRDLCMDFAGVDPIKSPIPVQPGMHYTMGGTDTNVDGETELKGFFAAGECACVSAHGANRLGGNSLLETLVFGARSGKKASEYVGMNQHPNDKDSLQDALSAEEDRIELLKKRNGKENPYEIKNRLAVTMKDKFGIFRNQKEMVEGRDEIKRLLQALEKTRAISRTRVFNYDYVWMRELEGNLDIALLIAEGAIKRTESRGSHSRTDHKTRNDAEWLKHTVARHSPDGPAFSYKNVTITRFKPEERKY